jgi:hypothetical protein
LYPRNPMGRSHKAFSPPRTHLQTADGTLRFFTVSQSYAEQPVKTMREIPRYVDSRLEIIKKQSRITGWLRSLS